MWKQIEWAGGGADFVSRDSKIPGGRREPPMTKQQLDGAHVGSTFEKVNGKSMAPIPVPG